MMFSVKQSYDQRELKRGGVLAASFRLKYTYLIIFGLAFSLVVFAAPGLYLVQQNYEIFAQLAYSPTPELLTQLEAEMKWMYWYFAGSALGVITLGSILAIRFSGHISAPVRRVEHHMEAIISGQYYRPSVPTHRGDEFYSLIANYNRLCKNLQIENQEDLQSLAAILKELPNSEAQKECLAMIAKKSQQLGEQNLKRKDLALTYLGASPDRAAF